MNLRSYLVFFSFLLFFTSAEVSAATWSITPPIVPTFQTSQTFNAVTHGSLDNTCTTDMSAKITTWIATIPNNSEIHFPAGCYMVNGIQVVENDGEKYLGDAVTLANKKNIIFSGAQVSGDIKTIFKITRDVDLNNPDDVLPRSNHPSVRRTLIFDGIQGLMVKNIRIEGTNTVANTDKTPADFGQYRAEFEAEHAFRVLGSKQVLIENVEVDAVWGDGLYVGENSEDVTILNATVSRNGRQGLALTDGIRIRIDNLRIESSSRGAIDIEPNLEHTNLKDVEIRNSYFRFHLAAFPVRRAYNVYYHDNTIDQRHRGGGMEIIILGREDERLQNMKFSNNTLLSGTNGSNQGGFVINHTDNVEISGNTVVIDPKTNLDKRVGAKLTNVDGTVVVSNNNFGGACHAYIADIYSAPVQSSNNVTNTTNCGTPSPSPTKYPSKSNSVIKATIGSPRADQTAAMKLLGNPTKDGPCTPDNGSTNVYARNPWAMKFFNNKLYIGNGEGTSGHGSAKICTYSPSLNKFTKEFDTEALEMDTFRIISNQLIVPGKDPEGKWVSGDYYSLSGAQWKKNNVGVNMYKLYDVEFYNNIWYAAVGRSESNAYRYLAHFSGTDPITGNVIWAASPYLTTSNGDHCCSRTMKFFRLGGKLYGSESPAQIIRVNNPESIDLLDIQTFFPDLTNTVHTDFKIALRKEVVLNNRMYYIGGNTVNDHHWFPRGLYTASNEQDSQRITFTDANNDLIEDDGRQIWDVVVQNGQLYVLSAIPVTVGSTTGPYRISVIRSTNGSAWTEVVSFSHDTFARSFEILDNTFYFGMGSFYDQKETLEPSLSAKTGDIISLAVSDLPSITVTQFPTQGDTDGDGDVDIFDYNVVISNFGKSVTGASNGDLDTDGDVDIFDYNVVISNFGK